MSSFEDTKAPSTLNGGHGADHTESKTPYDYDNIRPRIPTHKRTPDEYLADEGERLGLYRAGDFALLPLPARTRILGPWLVEQSLTMLYAERGLGKTMLMMGMADAISKGKPFLGYPAANPATVLYIDGEMSPTLFQERLGQIGHGDLSPNLYIISAPLAFDPWLNLHDEYGRMQIEEIIKVHDIKVLILDNKSTLASMEEDDKARGFAPIQEWLIRLRSRGLAIILVHHAGKNGRQRGSSLNEVVMDTVIRLGKPQDGQASPDGARFVMEFEKTRHFYGSDTDPKLITAATFGGHTVWTVQDCLTGQKDERRIKAVELKAEGLSQREIAQQLGVSAATINSWFKQG